MIDLRRRGGIELLKDPEIQELRRSVEAAQKRPWTGPFRWAVHMDGPLAGIRVRMKPDSHLHKEMTMGWGTVTNQGCVVTIYKQSGVADQWLFRGYDCPGRRESGLPLPDKPTAPT